MTWNRKETDDPTQIRCLIIQKASSHILIKKSFDKTFDKGSDGYNWLKSLRNDIKKTGETNGITYREEFIAMHTPCDGLGSYNLDGSDDKASYGGYVTLEFIIPGGNTYVVIVAGLTVEESPVETGFLILKPPPPSSRGGAKRGHLPARSSKSKSNKKNKPAPAKKTAPQKQQPMPIPAKNTKLKKTKLKKTNS